MAAIPSLRSAAALSLVLAAAPAARAGWTEIAVGAGLYDVDFPVDCMTGYAVGSTGDIFKTTDAGATWINVQNPAYTDRLNRVHFPVNASTGWAVGESGRIVITVDGGTNWTAQTSGVSVSLRSVYFVDDQTGYVGGTFGTILKTTDGGANWTDISIGGAENMQDFCFPVDATTGYLATSAQVLKTVDGGANWTDASLPANWYPAVDFPLNASTGWAAAQTPGSVHMTSDGGSGWSGYGFLGGQPRNLDFADAATGYITTSVGTSLIYKTDNSGSTWSTQYLPTGVYADSLCAVDALRVYAVSGNGIIKTSDGGGSSVAMHPTAVGTDNSFSQTTGCTGGSEYDCVNDQTGNASSGYPATPDTGSRVRDNNGQTNREMYALANGLIPAGSIVTGIDVRAHVNKAGTDPGVRLSYKRVGIDAGFVDGATQTIQWGYINIGEVWSGLNWTPADIDALEIGIKHMSGGAILVAQVYVAVTYTNPGGPTAGTNYRSIGTLATYNQGNATVAATGNVVTFAGGANLPATIGLGDKLVIGASTYFIHSRDSATRVTLQAPTTTAHTNAAYSISRAYSTLQAWEDGRSGNLVGESRSEVGVCYNDSAFTSPLLISGSTTDATHFMKLTVAPGHRHNGMRNTGARIDAQGGFGGVDAITVQDEYTQVEWLEIKGIQDAGDGVYFAASPAADNGIASGLFVHSCSQISNNAGVRIGAQNVSVRNCLLTGGTTLGVALDNGSASIENCTIVGSQAGGTGVGDAIGTTISVKNTISVNHPAGNDFVLGSTISYFGNNMYQAVTGFNPASYQGGNKAPPADLESLLVSLSSEDFHLESNGHSAGGTGLELYSSFSHDIDGTVRFIPWDIGADDDHTAAPTTGTTSKRIIVWREAEPN